MVKREKTRKRENEKTRQPLPPRRAQRAPDRIRQVARVRTLHKKKGGLGGKGLSPQNRDEEMRNRFTSEKSSALAVKIVGLTKVFKSGIRQRRTIALNSLTLEVKEGEILGYLGPNGAGKTTTFKILLGLIRPTEGEAWLLGRNIRDVISREGVGFLPEQPYFYDYLTAREFLDFYGQLYNLSKKERRRRVTELLELVGLQNVASTHLRKFSRGMLQRIGVAQALINEPQLIFLDEPMVSLDPIGRKQMRDIILRLKSEGKTVIYSSHILSDVEAICDRVAILSRGRLLGVEQPDVLLGTGERLVEMNIEGLDEKGKMKIKRLTSNAAYLPRAYPEGRGDFSSENPWVECEAGEPTCRSPRNLVERGNRIIVNVPSEEIAQEVQKIVAQRGAKLISLIPRMESLEDVFIRKMKEEG